MELFYCKGSLLNFGDDMNEWFWDAIFPDFHEVAPNHTMFGIGSILWRSNVEQFTNNIVVMGSGTGVGVLPDMPRDTMFQFVRGPRTAKQFGLAPDRHITDPACCTPLLADMEPSAKPHGDTILVPHAGAANLPLDWNRIAEAADMRFVTPSADARTVIRDIAGAKLVLAESMHAAILADAYRVPWIPVAIRPNFWNFKWQDWADSMEMELQMESALDGLKRTYGVLKSVREGVRGMLPKPKTPGRRQVQFATGDALSKTQEYYLTNAEKDMARSRIARHAGLIERLLIADLKRLRKKTPHLSRDEVLKARQQQIHTRIDETRDLFAS